MLKVFIICAFLALTLGSQAYGSQSKPGEIKYFDLDQDGKIDKCVIVEDTESISEFPRVIASVYSPLYRINETGDWRTSVSFMDETWFLSRGKGEIAIVFTREMSKLRAAVYEDMNGDGKISYVDYENGTVVITESSFPTIVFVAERNWNQGTVTMYYDGQINILPFWPGWSGIPLLLDGIYDYKIVYYDMDIDGKIDIEYGEIMDPPRVFDSVGTNIFPKYFVVDEYGGRNLRGNPAFWRFLGLTRTLPEIDSIIAVDWDTGKIVRINPAIPVHYNFEGISFSNFIYDKKIGYAQWWENGFYFYDLSGERRGAPQLSIRLGDDPGETGAIGARKGQGEYDNFRYSWDFHENTNPDNVRWSFGILGLGFVPYNHTNAYPFGVVNRIPYEDAPNFIFSQNWTGVIFTADEAGIQRGLEGLYENPDLAAILWYKRNNYKVVPYFPWVGNRADWNYSFSGQVQLYISNLDKKLHLLNAQRGIWLVNLNESIEYESTNGKFIDKITRNQVAYKVLKEGSGQHIIYRMTIEDIGTYRVIDTLESLLYFPDAIVYYGSNNTIIKQISVSPVIMEMSPPRTHEDWLWQKMELSKYGSYERLKDFFNLFETDKKLTITNGRVVSSAWNEEGWAVLLELTDDGQVYLTDFDKKIYVDDIELKTEIHLSKGLHLLSDHKKEGLDGRKVLITIDKVTETHERFDVWPATILLLAVVFSLGYYNYLRGKNKVKAYALILTTILSVLLVSFSISPPIERYTELYFTEPLQLKATWSSTQHVDITIVNREGAAAKYNYELVLRFYKNGIMLHEEKVFFSSITLESYKKASLFIPISPSERLQHLMLALQKDECRRSEDNLSVKVSVRLFYLDNVKPYREIWHWFGDL